MKKLKQVKTRGIPDSKYTVRKGLPASAAGPLSDLDKEGNAVFTIDQMVKRVGSRERARLIASRMSKKGWLERLSRGTYLVLELGAGSRPEWTADSFYIASKLVTPYYIGYYSMLNHYGWTEQVPLSVDVVTTKKIKSKEIHGVRYNFISISKGKFFGTIEKFIRGHKIIVSDPEKTLVDALDHPEYCGGISEVAKALINAHATIDWIKLVTYAEKLGNGAVFKRLGYLTDVLGIPLSGELALRIKSGVTTGYSLLSPGAPKTGTHISKWNLILNVTLSKKSVLS